MRGTNHYAADAKLREDVISRIQAEPSVTSKNLGIGASGRVVTLTGFAGTCAEKYAVQRAVRNVYGVRAIVNDIEVRPGDPRMDAEIAHELLQALDLDPNVNEEDVRAIVSDGGVTLEGVVGNEMNRIAAEACARNVAGVRGIANHIRIRPRASEEEILEKIEEALFREGGIPCAITVSVDEGNVRLYGTARSWAEREIAESIALGAPGVTRVVNELVIAP